MCLLWMTVSCSGFNDHDINIKISETENTYSMYAHFNPASTRKLQEYMDKKIGDRNNTSFVNSRIDGKLGFDAKTTFYLKLEPGELKIKLDKDKNSYESYSMIKKMCEGIKEVLK